MKFSTILRSTIFTLFIFTATATFAHNDSHFTNTEAQINDKEEVHNIAVISGRMAEVTDSEADRNRNASSYTMSVKVMKAANVVAEATSNTGFLTLDLEDLEAGIYLFVVTTPDGTSRQFVSLQ